MSEPTHVEVPVTRRAAVTRIGTVAGSYGDFRLDSNVDFTVTGEAPQVMIWRPGGGWRGPATLVDYRLLYGPASMCLGDIVYRVEPA